MPRRLFSAVVVLVITAISGVLTIVSDSEPLLGLDLQGGVSVVLQPAEEASDEQLDQALEIIRNRVDALGVAEPEISRQDDTIVVALPGVDDQQRALALVGQTAELRFRPVLFDLGPADAFDPTLDPDAVDGVEGSEDAPAADDPAADDPAADDEESFGGFAGRFAPFQTTTTAEDGVEEDGVEEDETTTTTAADDVGATDDGEPDGTADGEEGVDGSFQSTLTPEQLAITEACSSAEVTAPEEDIADQPVLLTDEEGNLLCLGPTLLTGNTLETAQATLDPAGQWTVNPVFKNDGIGEFNSAALLCYVGAPDFERCPSGRLAIVLDHVVVSAPAIQAQIYQRDEIVISGGNGGGFAEEEARDLAQVLRFGALPFQLETQQARTVSATIGDDVLRSGVIAGALGLALVALYLLSYYRLAGLVAIAGLGISGVLLWSIISWLGGSVGLALSLAGIVGLIVSVGVSADSNIVYFENVKDAYRTGRKVSTSVERAYQSAISTIIKADAVSLIAAVLLYWLTVGAVRGFAFYLGLATLLDLFISWLFMRPALAFIASRSAVEKNPRLLGLPTRGDS